MTVAGLDSRIAAKDCKRLPMVMKRCLVVGCAANVWDDVRKAREIGEYDSVYCVKMAGIDWPEKFDVWITLHPEFMDRYKEDRRKKGFPDGYQVVGPLESEVGRHAHHDLDRRVTYRWPQMTSSASSGIYAAKVALEDGFERIVLAGVPMVKELGHFARGKTWDQVGAFLSGYEKSIPFLKGKVKSLSGYTMKTLGAPTSAWLYGAEE